MQALKRGLERLERDVFLDLIPRDPDRWEVCRTGDICPDCRVGNGKGRTDSDGRIIYGIKKFKWKNTNVERIVAWKCGKCGEITYPSYPSPASSNRTQKELNHQALAADRAKNVTII